MLRQRAEPLRLRHRVRALVQTCQVAGDPRQQLAAVGGGHLKRQVDQARVHQLVLGRWNVGCDLRGQRGLLACDTNQIAQRGPVR